MKIKVTSLRTGNCFRLCSPPYGDYVCLGVINSNQHFSTVVHAIVRQRYARQDFEEIVTFRFDTGCEVELMGVTITRVVALYEVDAKGTVRKTDVPKVDPKFEVQTKLDSL